MRDDSRSSATGGEEGKPDCQLFLVPCPEWARVTMGGTVLGVVTLLHLSLIVYLTIPPVPTHEEHQPFTESSAGALEVTFVKATPAVGAMSTRMALPPVGHPLPRLSGSAAEKRACGGILGGRRARRICGRTGE